MVRPRPRHPAMTMPVPTPAASSSPLLCLAATLRRWCPKLAARWKSSAPSRRAIPSCPRAMAARTRIRCPVAARQRSRFSHLRAWRVAPCTGRALSRAPGTRGAFQRARSCHRVSDGQHGDHGALHFHRRIGAFPQAPPRDLGVQRRLGQFLAAANGRSLPWTPAHSRRRLADETERVCLAAMRDLGRPRRARPRHRYHFIGDDNLVWNTDYPHPDAPDPNQVLPWFSAQPISEDSKRKILWDNAVRLYGSRLLESAP